MQRGIIAVVVLALIGVGGYVWMNKGGDAMEAVKGVAGDATSAVEGAVEATTEAASDAASTATEAVTETVEATTEAAAEAVEGAVDAATDTAAAAAEATTEAASTAVEAATDTTVAATDTAAAATEETGAMAGMADLLTVDGFDYDKVVEMVDGSELGGIAKTTLKAGLDKAKDNPELLSGILDKVKAAMGM